jgi:hypothetical protein
MATGDQTDVAKRLRAVLPPWFGASTTAVLEAVVEAGAWALAFVYSLYAYAKLQTRILTATGGWLDLISGDFFGLALPRRPGQPDASFRAMIIASLFRERATREGVRKVLFDITGRQPVIIEPERPMDTGAWDFAGYWDVPTFGWGEHRPYETFVIAYRPYVLAPAVHSDAGTFSPAQAVTVNLGASSGGGWVGGYVQDLTSPTGVLDFVAQSYQLPYAYARAGPATALTAAGSVVSFAANQIRVTDRGCLIEAASANLLAYSEQLDDPTWLKSGSTITADAAVAPDGAQTMDKLVESAGNTDHFVQQGATIVADTTNTFSVFAKLGERSRIVVRPALLGVGAQALFDLSAGTVSAATGIGGGTLVGAHIEPVAGGYRCSVAAISPGATTLNCRVWLADGSGATTYTGDGASGAYVWGAQCEQGAVATSYIRTTALPVTRAADQLSVTAGATDEDIRLAIEATKAEATVIWLQIQD